MTTTPSNQNTEPTDADYIETCRANGVVFHQNAASQGWYMRDKFGQPDMSIGIYQSDAAAARAWCELNGKSPIKEGTEPAEKPPGREALLLIPKRKYERRNMALAVSVALNALLLTTIIVINVLWYARDNGLHRNWGAPLVDYSDYRNLGR